MNICITGLTASGKTSIGKHLSKKYSVDYFSFSQFLLREVEEINPKLLPCGKSNDHLWSRAQKLDDYRKETNLDKKIDIKFANYLDNKDKFVCDSFTYPFLNKTRNTYFVYLKNDLDTRLERAHRSSDSISIDKLKVYIQEKDNFSRDIIIDMWNVDIFSDKYLTLFDLIIDDTGTNHIDYDIWCNKISYIVEKYSIIRAKSNEPKLYKYNPKQ